jgi:hypothetical protein
VKEQDRVRQNRIDHPSAQSKWGWGRWGMEGSGQVCENVSWQFLRPRPRSVPAADPYDPVSFEIPTTPAYHGADALTQAVRGLNP